MARYLPKLDKWRSRLVIDLVVFGGLAIAVSALSVSFDAFDMAYEYSRHHEEYEVDEFLTFGFIASIALAVFSWRRIQDQRHEIAARKHAEEHAQRLANVDALTGLPNRRRLEAELDVALAKSKRHRKVAFLLFDLNRFKPINDVYGHQAGDEVLIDFARRLSAAVDRDSLVFRLGGDEFAVLTGKFSDIEQITRLARRMLSVMDIPFSAGNSAVSLGVGIGIAIAPDDATTTAELMRRADVALYRAKSRRVSAFHFFEQHMDKEVLRRSRLEADMRSALVDGMIHPHFQPIVRLGDRQVVGFEALARWTHPKHGEVKPVEFIAIAEDCGMMPKLSEHLLRRACEVAATWPSHLILSFNISPTEIGDPTLVLRVLKTLGDSGLSPRRLEIEITESALVSDYDAARKTLAAFRDAGISIALDDFGAGNSSLHHLRELRFDRLKIDRSFVAQMMESPEAAAMVRVILHLASALNLSTTAEGIEDPEQLDPLIAEGCAEAQGFHFSAALSEEGVRELLEADTFRETG